MRHDTRLKVTRCEQKTCYLLSSYNVNCWSAEIIPSLGQNLKADSAHDGAALAYTGKSHLYCYYLIVELAGAEFCYCFID